MCNYQKLILILTSAFYLLSCKTADNNKVLPHISKINRIFKNDLNTLLSASQTFNNVLLENNSSDRIIESFKELRFAYKKTEAILSYTKAITNATYINGAPLTKVERFNPKVVIKEPEGLQTMDEIVFSDSINIDELKILINKLIPILEKEVEFFADKEINEYHLYESLRQQIIRIGSMGLTGFDTPGSLNGINESIVCLKTMKDYTNNNQLKITLNSAIEYLKLNNNFESLNRLIFFKEYLNPILSSLTQEKNKFNSKQFSLFQPPTSLSPTVENIFDNNILDPSFFSRVNYDKEKSNLGRTLFFDSVLSENNKLSCASCHDPKKAFTDGKIKSVQGHGDKNITRNSPTLINSVFASAYFLDHRINNLQKQIEDVIENNLEFNSDYSKIIERLNKIPSYQEKFKEVYGENAKITVYGISHSLVHYINSLTSFNSEFDKYMRGEVPSISKEVENGFNLFMGKAACGTCHFAPNFSGLLPPNYIESETEVLGVPESLDKTSGKVDPDLGRYKSGILKDGVYFQKHAFKTVTIRNVSLTAPYMHNGVFQTLEEVMDFYNNGGGVGYGIILENQTLAPDSLFLTDQEQNDIIAFMKSLTDHKFQNHSMN